MERADLHIHSTSSDGLLSPEEIVNWAVKRRLSAISITDHDSISGIDIADNYAKIKGIEVVPGIELSTEYEGIEVHMLGYYFERKCEQLNSFIYKMKNNRTERAKEMLIKLNRMGYSLNYDDLLKESGEPSSIGRPHVARAMIYRGYCQSIEEAFDKFIGFGKPAYVDRYKISPFEAIQLIAKCGGVSSVAHPGLIINIDKKKLIKKLKSWGLAGIEVFHTRHSEKDIAYFGNIASELGLIETGGTDCHGVLMNNEPMLGSVTMPYSNVKELKNLSRI